MIQTLPGIDAVSDVSQLRTVLYQSGRLVHGPYGMGLQPVDADLTAIAALSGTGLAARTGSGTWATRTITGTTNEITVTNGNGVSGNPTLVLSGSIGAAKAFRRGNILGTVSQSSGVPTGELIEQGSNANGHYTRFADGTQICWHSFTGSTVDVAYGAIFRSASQTWTYPAAFISSASVAAVVNAASIGIWAGSAAAVASSVTFRLFAGSSIGTTQNAQAIAVGRWF